MATIWQGYPIPLLFHYLELSVMLNNELKSLALSLLLFWLSFWLKSDSICKSEGELLAVELLYTFQEIGCWLSRLLEMGSTFASFKPGFSLAYLYSWALYPFLIIFFNTNMCGHITKEH